MTAEENTRDEQTQQEKPPQEQSPERRQQGTGATDGTARGPHATPQDVDPPPFEEGEEAPPQQPSRPKDHDLGEEEERLGGPAGEGTGEVAEDPGDLDDQT